MKLAYFYLLDSQVKEGKVAAHRNDRLRSLASHRSAETTVQLDDHQFGEHVLHLFRRRLTEGVVVLDRIPWQFLDAVPVHRGTLLLQEARVQPLEAIKLLLPGLHHKRIIRNRRHSASGRRLQVSQTKSFSKVMRIKMYIILLKVINCYEIIVIRAINK